MNLSNRTVELGDLIRENARLREALGRSKLLNHDLKIVVKDQKAHIANLEAELLPHLRAGDQGEQESLL